MRTIKKDDEVIVIAGKDKGRRGRVLKVVAAKANSKRGLRAYVEGINIVKKHQRGNPHTNTQSAIIEKEAALDISNIALWDPISKKASRVGVKTLEDGKKVRYFKTTGEVVDI